MNRCAHGAPAVTLEVLRLGYRPLTQRVPVGEVPLALPLSETAVELDALVVTGTAGATVIPGVAPGVSERTNHP